MTNHSQYCIKEPNDNCVNCCPACSNCEEKESEDEMSEQTNYPKRGCMSDDGKYYTHTDGSVHVFTTGCTNCWCAGSGGKCAYPKGFVSGHCGCTIVAGAYVQTDDEREACDMARTMIERCQAKHGNPCDCLRVMCADWVSASCPARVFLAEHDQPDAWEVK